VIIDDIAFMKEKCVKYTHRYQDKVDELDLELTRANMIQSIAKKRHDELKEQVDAVNQKIKEIQLEAKEKKLAS